MKRRSLQKKPRPPHRSKTIFRLEAGEPVTCPRCGTEYDADLPACPVCPQRMVPGAARTKKRKRRMGTPALVGLISGCVVLFVGIAFGVLFALRVIGYQRAVTDLEEGRYLEAYQTFRNLQDFRDSDELAELCRKHMTYQEAKELIAEGRYEEALGKLSVIKDFEDAPDLIELCNNNIDYASAIRLRSEGRYYEAFCIFTSLGVFSDAAQQALECIQPRPETGLLEQGPSFCTGSSEITFVNTTGSDCMYILSLDEGELWGILYARAFESVTSSIEKGRYTMLFATGDNWFGADCFGDFEPIPLLVNGQRTLVIDEYVRWTIR